jgi:uncharacterized membrane protein
MYLTPGRDNLDTGAMDEQEYRERLARDAAGWRRDSLISEEQERAILARYGLEGARAARALRLGWFATAVSIVGAIVLAAGVVLLFAANWDTMPSWFRAGAVFAGMAAAYAIGYALMERYGMQRLGSALLLLGVLLYEAGLFLLADIYDMPVVPVDSPILLLLAGIGALPLAYLFGSRIILLLGIANFTGWAIFGLAARYQDWPRAGYALIIFATLGVGLYTIGRLHGLRRELAQFSETYMFPGLLIVMGLTYVFAFDEPWRSMLDEGIEAYAAPALVYASLALAAVLVIAQWALQQRDLEAHIDAGARVALLGLGAIVATWPGWTGYAVVFNGVYFAIAAGLVTRGYLRADERYVNLGLLAVAIGLITRYVDVFWSLLAGSAFFIIGGVLLLALAFALERMRRGLLRGMTSGGEGPRATGAAA